VHGGGIFGRQHYGRRSWQLRVCMIAGWRRCACAVYSDADSDTDKNNVDSTLQQF